SGGAADAAAADAARRPRARAGPPLDRRGRARPLSARLACRSLHGACRRARAVHGRGGGWRVAASARPANCACARAPRTGTVLAAGSTRAARAPRLPEPSPPRPHPRCAVGGPPGRDGPTRSDPMARITLLFVLLSWLAACQTSTGVPHPVAVDQALLDDVSESARAEIDSARRARDSASDAVAVAERDF